MRPPIALIVLASLGAHAGAQVMTPPTEKPPPFKNIRTLPPELSEELKEALAAREKEAQEQAELRRREREERRRMRQLSEMRRDRRDLLMTRIAHLPVPELGEADLPADMRAVEANPLVDDETRENARAVFAERQQRLREIILASPRIAQFLAAGGLNPDRFRDLVQIQDAREILAPISTNPENDLPAELYARGIYGDLEHVMHEEIVKRHNRARNNELVARVGGMSAATVGEFTALMLNQLAEEGIFAFDGMVDDVAAALRNSQRPLPEIERHELIERARAQVLDAGDAAARRSAAEELLSALSRDDLQQALMWATQGE